MRAETVKAALEWRLQPGTFIVGRQNRLKSPLQQMQKFENLIHTA